MALLPEAVGPYSATTRGVATGLDRGRFEPVLDLAGDALRGEVTHYVADIRRARELLDWQPQVPLEAGIPRAVEWFRVWRSTHPNEDDEIVPERVPGEIEHGFKPTGV